MSQGEGSRGEFTLSFVVPLFDEAPGIDHLWDELARAGRRVRSAGLVDDWEAVLVDDGSSDATPRLLDALASEQPRLTVVHHEVNQGIGSALASGMRAATGTHVLYTDADLPFDLGLVEELLGPIVAGEADLVSARRIGRAREGAWRAVQSMAFNLTVRLVFGLEAHDVNFACKVARRDLVPDRFISTTGMVDVEWLLYAKDRGAHQIQPRVEFVPRRWGRSTLGSVRTIPAMLGDLQRLRAARRGSGGG